MITYNNIHKKKLDLNQLNLCKISKEQGTRN